MIGSPGFQFFKPEPVKTKELTLLQVVKIFQNIFSDNVLSQN